jgi:large conductance mechanosensitive channel
MSKEDEILKELQEIRKVLTPKPPPPPPKDIREEFLRFLSKYKVLGLAVAFIMAIYLGALIQALVDDLIMPIVQFVVPDVQWEEIIIGPFRVGHFVGTLITFIIIAFVVFLIVKFASRLHIE